MSHSATGLSHIVQQVLYMAPLHDLFADWCGASEAQLTDVRVFRQTLSHHPTCRGEEDQLHYGSMRTLIKAAYM